jgi:phosphatidylserine synthase
MHDFLNLLKALFLTAVGAFFGFLAVLAGNSGQLVYAALAVFTAGFLVLIAGAFLSNLLN